MVALYAVWYNFVRIHKTLRGTPAMEAKVTERFWSLEDLVREPLHKSGRHSERSLRSEESRNSSQAQNDRMRLVQSFLRIVDEWEAAQEKSA